MATLSYQVFRLRIARTAQEPAMDVLMSSGCQGFIVEAEDDDALLLSAYFETTGVHLGEVLQTRLVAAHVAATLIEGQTFGLSAPDQTSQRDYEPFLLAGGYRICPPGSATTPADLVIAQDSAFGTGLHPTTQLTAQVLLTHLKQGQTVLDVGTGSGILAVLARRCGAGGVVAVDISPAARLNARRNFNHNQMAEIEIRENLADVSEKFDLILANVLFQTQLHIAPALVSCLAKSGHLILCGITSAETSAVLAAYPDLVLVSRECDSPWYLLVLTRP